MPAVVLADRSTTDPTAPNVVVDPLATFPRRLHGRDGDGHSYELLTSRAGVAAMSADGRLAEALVADEGERVVVDIRAELPGLPDDVVARLVGQAFAHPAVRAARPVLVTLPRGESTVLEEVQAHLDGASARVAGVTCLVEGKVRAAFR